MDDFKYLWFNLKHWDNITDSENQHGCSASYVKEQLVQHFDKQNTRRFYLRMFFVVLHDPSLQLMVLIWYKFVCR